MKNGELIFQGTPKEIFTPEKLLNLFDIQATFATMPNSDKPLVLAYDLVKEH
jgi:iron complex transport system ATP-binding protein